MKAALACGAAAPPSTDDDSVELARRALVQLAFSSAIAAQPVERVTADVGTAVELSELLEQALRWCA